ncbi:SDR family oxidoreductase [Streptomyces sp. SID8352]|uniref:SDR family NAD(P)-dependent oxidoreductase n=1 Tax=Streptomyces sp. SID8352 TaxID=2690338 RepID=UPI00136F7C6D|nr:SDR family oxidoreductase [Streptomyces sp. SID8352]MYU22602.1 glucose 1-dehydrogenase [Streptomyces sp. SID8352]
MTRTLSRRTALVTGGTIGIGREITRRLLDEGVDVVIVGRRRELLDATVRELTAAAGEGSGTVSGVAADVAVVEDLDRVVAAALEPSGRIDILVNNAGVFDDATLLSLPKESWDQVIAVNLTAPFLLTQRVGKVMAGQGHGAIVNLASVDGHGVDGSYVAYNVSKAGVLHLTRQTAVELGPLGIRCNSVSPGWTRTPMVESALSEEQLRVMADGWKRSPNRRMVTPGEVAAAVVFLAGDQASGINGTDIVVDGGTISNLYLLETLPG